MSLGLHGDKDLRAILPKDYRHRSVCSRLRQSIVTNQRIVGRSRRYLLQGHRYMIQADRSRVEVPTFEPGALMDKARYAKYQKGNQSKESEDTDK